MRENSAGLLGQRPTLGILGSGIWLSCHFSSLAIEHNIRLMKMQQSHPSLLELGAGVVEQYLNYLNILGEYKSYRGTKAIVLDFMYDMLLTTTSRGRRSDNGVR